MLLGPESKIVTYGGTTVGRLVLFVLFILTFYLAIACVVSVSCSKATKKPVKKPDPVFDRIEVYELRPVGRWKGASFVSKLNSRYERRYAVKFILENGTARIYLHLREKPEPKILVRGKLYEAISFYGDKIYATDGKDIETIELKDGDVIGEQELKVREEEIHLADYLVTDKEVLGYKFYENGKLLLLYLRLTVDGTTFDIQITGAVE